MGRGAQRFGSMREFGSHRGGGGKFFSKWKKEKGKVDVWLHTKALPIAVYRHTIPMIQIREDRDDKSVKHTFVWSKNLVCHETIPVLESQYFYDDDGKRKKPPERCGICKLIEWCRTQAFLYEDTRDEAKPKGLSFTTPIFRFEGDEDEDGRPVVRILHIGGICNLFKKDLNDAQKKDMREAKILASKAWQENAIAKCQYALFVVNDADPDAGVQVAIEASSLGDKVKSTINEELEDNGRDITKTPYCLRWKYRENEEDFNKKYGVNIVAEKKPTARILRLIRGESPDLPEDLTDPFNQLTVRAQLERHCVLPKGVVPWDDLFPSEAQIKKWAKEDEEAEAADRATAEAEGEKSDDEDDDADDEADDEAEADGDDDEVDPDEDVVCNECDKVMKVSDKKCPHCGHVYIEDDEPAKDEQVAKPAAEKPMKKRGESKLKDADLKAGKPKRGFSDAADAPDADVPF